MFRIGFGNDIHRLVAGRPLVIGGVSVESEVRADGHSDADVLLHAVTDALLGALALGDIGTHFPNDDERWLGADSSEFLRYTLVLVKSYGYSIANIDSTVSLERPRLRDHVETMRANIAAALEIDLSKVSVKAKTGEQVDSVGEGRAISADAVVLISRT
ncbi:MAG: 2-C-methyl-D-erythritol 2,4-cyclodiphosphate synthase [Pyrinomonadaceae bacterium]